MDKNTKIIFHVDVNSAFLSWSAVKLLKDNPDQIDLRTIPSAVGGDVESRHGIITARSIPAKKYGVTTGEPVVKALQKCPNLVIVSGDFKTYREYSARFIDVLRSYSPLVEQVSIDEAFIDMTEPIKDMYQSAIKLECSLEKDLITNGRVSKEHFTKEPVSKESIPQESTLEEPLTKAFIAGESANKPSYNIEDFALILASNIKEEIKQTLGFTVNVGISTNKLLSKMASDFEKPDKIHTLFPDEIRKKMWPLPIGDLYGCGKQTSLRLSELGMKTIGDVANTDQKLLENLLGIKQGDYIYRSSNGLGNDEVNPLEEDAKSYSNETTTKSDINFDNYESKMPQTLRWLSESVARRLQRDGVFASTVSVNVKTDSFKRRSKQMGIADSTNDAEIIFKTATRLMDELVLGIDGLFAKGYSIRLVGVGASDLDKGQYRQMSLFEISNNEGSQVQAPHKQDAIRAQKQRLLREMTKSIEDKFGKGAIHKGK